MRKRKSHSPVSFSTNGKGAPHSPQIGKSPFYSLQLLRSFNFQSRCTKPEILQPPSIKTVFFSPFSDFQAVCADVRAVFPFFLSLQIS